jgi:hypothetical protein
MLNILSEYNQMKYEKRILLCHEVEVDFGVFSDN